MRTKFEKKDLLKSGEFFNPIFETVFLAKYELDNVELGNDFIADYITIQQSIIGSIATNNRCFVRLFKDLHEVLAALVMIRLQIENLAVIYAETLYPYKILTKIYNTSNSLDDIRIKQVYINPTELRKDIDSKFGTNINDLYKKYSSYIHPDKSQKYLALRGWYNQWHYEDVANDTIAAFSSVDDMILVNQTISDVLVNYLDNINSKINNNESNNV